MRPRPQRPRGGHTRTSCYAIYGSFPPHDRIPISWHVFGDRSARPDESASTQRSTEAAEHTLACAHRTNTTCKNKCCIATHHDLAKVAVCWNTPRRRMILRTKRALAAWPHPAQVEATTKINLNPSDLKKNMSNTKSN